MCLRLCQYNLIAAGFYDGVMLYAQALNETLSQQRTGPGLVKRPRGDVVTKKMWNKTFPGGSSLFFLVCLFWTRFVVTLETCSRPWTNQSTALDENSLL